MWVSLPSRSLGLRPPPLVGNLLDIPKGFFWLSYTYLSKKHGMIYFAVRGFLTKPIVAGDVSSFRIFGTVIVVLNSIKGNKDLLEKS